MKDRSCKSVPKRPSEDFAQAANSEENNNVKKWRHHSEIETLSVPVDLPINLRQEGVTLE